MGVNAWPHSLALQTFKVMALNAQAGLNSKPIADTTDKSHPSYQPTNLPVDPFLSKGQASNPTCEGKHYVEEV